MARYGTMKQPLPFAPGRHYPDEEDANERLIKVKNMRKFQGYLLVLASVAALAMAGTAQAQVKAIPPRKVAPSFDCAKAKPGTIDQVICQDRELSILDRTMGLDYQRAQMQTPPVEKGKLLREQREFIANRNLCMKRKTDRQPCIAFAYESRIERLGEWIDRSAWMSE